MNNLLKLPCGGGFFSDESFVIEKKDGKEYIKTKNSWNDLVDRPFYKETAEGVVTINGNSLENQTLTFEDGYGGEIFAKLFNMYDVGFGTIGNEYRVVWDGVEYNCVCFAGTDEFPSIGGVENGCPFMLEYYDCWIMKAYSYDADGNAEIGATTHTFSVYETGERVTPIPIEYLPKPADYLPKAEYIADIETPPTADDYNNLLRVLREAGYLEE